MSGRCTLCEAALTSEEDRLSHLRMHVEGTNRAFHCPKCSYSATRRDMLRVHLDTHKDGRLYYCPCCPFMASNMTAFTRHSRIHKDDMAVDDNHEVFNMDSPKSMSSQQSQQGQSPFGRGNILNECSSFSFPENFSFGDVSGDVGENNRSRPCLQPEVQVKQEVSLMYACPVCDFNASSNEEMVEHLNEDEEDRLYRCDACDLTFCSFRSVTVHRETHMLDPGFNNIEARPRNFYFNKNPPSDDHFNGVPTNKPYKLPAQNFQLPTMQVEPMRMKRPTMYLDENALALANMQVVSKHESIINESYYNEERTHNNDRNEEAQSSSQKSRSRLRDRRTEIDGKEVAGKTGGSSMNGKYNKKIAGAKFKTIYAKMASYRKAGKKGNRRVPQRPNCVYCKKAFSCPSSLNLHLRTHTGEKPFKCDKCSFSTSQRGNLKTHLKTHNGILVKCQFCTYTGTNTNTVNAHIRAEHAHAAFQPHPVKGNPASINRATPGQRGVKKQKVEIKSDVESKDLAVKDQASTIASQQEQSDLTLNSETKRKIREVRTTGSNPNDGLRCKNCNVTCQSGEAFRGHECVRKMYGCSHCSYTCRTLHNLSRHWKTHKSATLVSCPNCSFKISNERGLARHIREAHDGRRGIRKESSPQI